MDDNYPTLKRPKKKLLYPATKTRVPDQWTQDIKTLEDVDKMFDNLDSKVEDFPSPSPEIHIPNINKRVEREATPLPPHKELLKCQMGANGDHKHPHHTPTSPELEIDSETPFKAHRPVKTSSPIEGNAMQPEHQERNKGDNSASPILFDCEDDNQDLETAERATEKPQHNNKRDESDDSIFETLPKKSAFDKMSTPKKKTRSTPTNTPVRPMRSEKKAAPSAPEKTTESVQVPTKAKGDMGSFLQRLKEAKQPKHTLAGISHARVLPPLPEPEPEDDFLILEDDVPFYVSIPNKYSKSTKGKRTNTSCSDTEAKGTAGEEHSADKQQDKEQDHRQESETLAGKTNINKGSESNPVATDKDLPSLDTTESDNVERLSQRDQTKKKKRQLKKVPSKVDGTPEDSGTETNDGISSKKIVKAEKTARKGSKPLRKDKENVQRKMTRAKENRRGQRTEGVEAQNQQLNSENQFDNDAPVSGASNVETEPTDLADVNLGQNKPNSQEQTSDEEGVIVKRKRKPPGEWWISSPDQNQDPQATEKQPMVKKTKQISKRSSSASTPVKAATGGGRKNQKPSSSIDSQSQKAEKNKVKKGKRKRELLSGMSEQSDEVFGQPIQDRALDQDSHSDSSPLIFAHKERSMSSGERAFHKVYQCGASEKKSSSPNCASPTRPEGGVRGSPRRIRKSPGNWWQVNPTADDQEGAFSQPQPQKSKKKQIPGNKKRQADKLLARSPSKPLEGAHKQKKRSLAATRDLFSGVVGSLPRSRDNVVPLKKQNNVTAPPAEDVEANHNVVSIQMDELQGAQDKSPSQDTAQQSVSKIIRSGPSSMIRLENYEEDDDTVLPSTTVQPALCVSDLCSAPLRPLLLQPKDEVNLRDWLKSLWPAAENMNRSSQPMSAHSFQCMEVSVFTPKGNTEVTPNDFEWYCYRGKAMGILVDLQTGTMCTGKMLLGSSMKKPLWVDHSATTVFNLLTGSVRVIVDCNKSRYNAGQSFMVPPGHAYSIHNINAQPVVLYFTRFFTEESNE